MVINGDKKMTELEAETEIKNIIPETIKGEVVEVIKREAISRIEHEATFAVIFQQDKAKVQEMIKSAKSLSVANPDLLFSGSEVDDKFKLENCAVFITATCK